MAAEAAAGIDGAASSPARTASESAARLVHGPTVPERPRCRQGGGPPIAGGKPTVGWRLPACWRGPQWPMMRGVPFTVLIVDDNARFRVRARRWLEADGYAVVAEAADGASALEAARRHRPEWCCSTSGFRT